MKHDRHTRRARLIPEICAANENENVRLFLSHTYEPARGVTSSFTHTYENTRVGEDPDNSLVFSNR
jgi:hypothetical protein